MQTTERTERTLTIMENGRMHLRVTELPRDSDEQQAYRVESASGGTYTVTYMGSGDGDPEYVALWECDCPAGQHGRDCKHLRAVVQYVDGTE